MKKKLNILIIILFSLFFVACSSSNNNIKASKMDHSSNLNYSIAQEISNLDKNEDFDDELIKALSIIVRSQKYYDNDNIELLSNEQSSNINQDNNLTKSTKITNDIKIKNIDKYINLVKQTDNTVISNNKSNNIFFVNNKDKFEWQIDIKKSDILKYLSENNISINNISNIQPYYTDNKLSYIEIGGKKIMFDELKSKFNLYSPNIIKITNNLTSISIYGIGYDNEIFDINAALNLKNKNYNYKQLLNYFFNDFNYKTI